MKEDFSELVEYLDEKFQNTATKEDVNNLSLNLLSREEFGQFEQEVKREFSDIKESINTLINFI